MALAYEPDFAAAFAPFAEVMASRPRPAVHDVQGRRDNVQMMFASIFGNLPETPDIESTKETFKSYDGHEINVFIVRKKERSSTPTAGVVHFHGGGMIAGTTELFLPVLKQTVADIGIPFFSIDYRLAPEVKGTTLVEDCYAGLKWVHENAEKLGVDRKRLGIMGESAGGGLAAGVGIMARDRGLNPPVAKQVLVYPMLDDRNIKVLPAIEPLAFWRCEDNITGWSAVLGDQMGQEGVSEYIAPARVKSTKGLPPTYIDTGTLDLFRDEDIDYAIRILKENIDVEMHLYPGVPHAFEALAPQISVTVRARENRKRALLSF